MKLGLGTAQFGMSYGISNSVGQVPRHEVERILKRATDRGVAFLDTAPAYGDSESLLGELLRDDNRFQIVTKTVPLKKDVWDTGDVDAVQTQFQRSLERLRCASVYAVLVHHANDLEKPGSERLIKRLLDFQKQGLVRHVGVSVYSPADIHRVLSHFTPSLVQIPMNLFDQRMIQTGMLKLLKQKGIEVHVRSAFLQGLLLLRAEQRHSYFQRWNLQFQRWERFQKSNQLTALGAALRFILRQPDVDGTLVGVCSVDELDMILSEIDRGSDLQDDPSALAVQDEDLVNPSRWPVMS